MALVGEAEVIVVANTDEFNAKMETLGAEGDLAGVGSGAVVAGKDAGEDLKSGVEDGTSGLKQDLIEDGGLAGAGLRTGVTDETDKMADDVEEDTSKVSKSLDDVGKHSNALKSTLEGLGIPSALLSGPAVAAEGFIGLTAEAFHLQNQMQSATRAIATTEGISVEAADKIGTAFLEMRDEFGGKELAEAFSTVSGQLATLNGHALTTKQSVAFMSQAATLATAAHVSLGDATTNVASTLQTFSLKTKDAADVSNILFNTANATGTSLDTVSGALIKVKSSLGGLAPPIGQLSGLFLDMADHGESGRKAVSALSTGFTSFLKPLTDQITAQKNYKIALAALPPSLRSLAEASLTSGKANTELYNASEKMSSKNAALVSQFQSAATAQEEAGNATKRLGFNVETATGQLLPMNEIIGKLHDQIKGMGDAQATATLSADGFGSSAARWVKIVQAGPDAFNKATEAVQKHNAVVKAAEEQEKTFSVAFKTLRSDAEDVAIEFGQEIAPVFQDVAGLVEGMAPDIETLLGGAFKILGATIAGTTRVIKDVVDWFKKGSAEAKAVGVVIGVALIPAFIRLGIDAVGALKDMAASAVEWGEKTLKQIGNVLTGNFSVRSSMEETAATSDSTTADMEADAAAQSEAIESVGVAEDDLVATSEAAAPEVDAALGPIGLAIGAIAIAAFLLRDHWRQVWDGIKEVALDAYHFIDNDVVHPIEKVFDEVVTFIKGHWELLVGIIGGPLIAAALLIYHFRDDIVKVFKDLVGEMEHLGEDIVKGLIDGLKDGVHLAEDAAKDVAHGVEDGIKDVLHIFSPSQVMHEIGGNVAQGLADGIRDKSSVAEREAKAMASRVRDAAKGGLGSVGGGGSGGALISLTLAKGAIEIHAVNTDEKKLEETIEKSIEDAFRRLNAELAAGISQLSAKASA